MLMVMIAELLEESKKLKQNLLEAVSMDILPQPSTKRVSVLPIVYSSLYSAPHPSDNFL